MLSLLAAVIGEVEIVIVAVVAVAVAVAVAVVAIAVVAAQNNLDNQPDSIT